jgi:transposase
MWTQKNRPRYDRDHLRYPSDLTDEEWAIVAPLIPPPRPGGGKRRTDMRAVVNGLMYILSTGCQWRYIPKDFPPRSTVYNYFVWWQCDRVLDRIHHALSHSSRALRRMPRKGGTRSQSHRRHHRQSEREERRKRGACIDPHG